MSLQTPSTDVIVSLLRCHLFRYESEQELQEGIAQVLVRDGIPFEPEVRMTPQDRIDFLIGKTGIEVKVRGSLADVTRQLHRYAQCPEIASLILVTNRIRHQAVPRELNRKPITVIVLGGVG